MRLIPVIERLAQTSYVMSLIHSKAKLLEVKAIPHALELRQQQMEDNRIGHCENEQHLHRRKTHLTLAADAVADEVAGAEQQLPHTIHNSARAQAPNLHHALAHAMPPDAPHACPL